MKLFSKRKRRKEIKDYQKEEIRYNHEEEVEEEPEDEDTNEEDIYEFELTCINCEDHVEYWDIPKGIKVSDYFKDKICEKCGCKLVETEETE